MCSSIKCPTTLRLDPFIPFLCIRRVWAGRHEIVFQPRPRTRLSETARFTLCTSNQGQALMQLMLLGRPTWLALGCKSSNLTFIDHQYNYDQLCKRRNHAKTCFKFSTFYDLHRHDWDHLEKSSEIRTSWITTHRTFNFYWATGRFLMQVLVPLMPPLHAIHLIGRRTMTKKTNNKIAC